MAKAKKTQKDSITFRVEPETKAALDEIAKLMNHDRSQVLNEAITIYLDLYKWQIEEIKRGLASADAGELTPHEDVLASWEARRADLLDRSR